MTQREGAPRTVEIGPERQQLIGVVFAKVERRPLSLSLRASGRVQVDETQVHDVVLKYDAYVEKLFVDQTGQQVRAGQPLLVLYSPELLSSERDYLVAVKSGGLAGNGRSSARRRNGSSSGASPARRIAGLRKRGTAEPRLTIHSPAAGTVLEKSVVAGTRARRGRRSTASATWAASGCSPTSSSPMLPTCAQAFPRP